MCSRENGQILKAGKVKKIWIGRPQVQNLAPARIFCCGISVKNLPFFLQFVFTKSLHVRDVLVDCTFALLVIGVT